MVKSTGSIISVTILRICQMAEAPYGLSFHSSRQRQPAGQKYIYDYTPEYSVLWISTLTVSPLSTAQWLFIGNNGVHVSWKVRLACQDPHKIGYKFLFTGKQYKKQMPVYDWATWKYIFIDVKYFETVLKQQCIQK